MDIQLTTIETKKFIIIGILSIWFLMAFSIWMGIVFDNPGLVLLIIPGLAAIFIFGHKMAKTTTIINIDNPDYILLNHKKINYSTVIGYFENDASLSQSALSFRLNTNKSIHIISSSIGKEGKRFKEIENQIITRLKNKNPKTLKLEYQDIYVKQMNIIRPIFIILTGIVILLDILLIYDLITQNLELPLQFFFVNFLLIWFVPYMKKGKGTT